MKVKDKLIEYEERIYELEQILDKNKETIYLLSEDNFKLRNELGERNIKIFYKNDWYDIYQLLDILIKKDVLINDLKFISKLNELKNLCNP